MPEEGFALYVGGDDGEGDADEGQDEDGGEEGGHVEVAVRHYDDAAQAPVAAEPLAYDRADYGERDGYAECGEQVWQRTWQAQLEVCLGAGCMEGAEEVERAGVDGAQAYHRVDQHGEEGNQACYEHLWEGAEAEPDDEQGRDRDYGCNFDENGDGKEGALQEARVRHERRAGEGDGGTEREACQCLRKRDAAVQREEAEVAREPRDYGGRCRHDVHGDGCGANPCLPQHDRCCEREGRRQDIAERYGADSEKRLPRAGRLAGGSVLLRGFRRLPLQR